MRILLTGGTGFFGRALTRSLETEDYQLRCVVRSGTVQRLETFARSHDIIETPTLFQNSADWWAQACKDIDIVIHAAWYAEPGLYLMSDRNIRCLQGSLSLAEGAVAAGVHRFVGIGTCFEYDLSYGRLSVDTPLEPMTLYAACKASLFSTLQHYLAAHDTSFLWARLFYLYGTGEHPNRLVPYLHQQLSSGQVADLTSGKQVRDYMNVDDAARLLLSDVFSNVAGATNICGTRERTVAEIATEIADIYGRRDLLNFGARPDNLSDPPVVVGLR